MSQKTYDAVTARILEALEKGVVPWQQPWGTGGVALGRHKNLISLKPYRGINALLTGMQGYESPYWLTYKQAQELGASVRKGEKGTPIVYYGRVERENAEGKVEDFMFLKHSVVFNVAQVEGLKLKPELLKPAPEARPFAPIQVCQTLVDAMPQRPRIQHAEAKAYYSPSLDYVNMPKPELFTKPERYYATLFHELGHSTGHKDRLARKTLTKIAAFGDHAYSQEELVAEMTAAFLCAETGIENATEKASASYLAHWIKHLKQDPKILIQAAGQAHKAADFIRGVKWET